MNTETIKMCESCGEKIATHHYGDIYHFCDDCNDEFLYEVAKNYGMIDETNHGLSNQNLSNQQLGDGND